MTSKSLPGTVLIGSYNTGPEIFKASDESPNSANDMAMPILEQVIPFLRRGDGGRQTTSPHIIAATTRSLPFNAAMTLGYIQKKTWSIVDPSKYDTREALQATADAYLDIWTKATAHPAVPFETPCERVEGSH